jgi:hypothetical protein
VAVVLTILLVAFLLGIVALGLFSKRSPREFLDWQPTRSPELEARNEQEDLEQLQRAVERKRERWRAS